MRKIFAAICAAVMLLCGALFAGCASSELEEYDVSDMVVFGSNWEEPNQNQKFIAFNIPFVTALIEVTAERGGFETSKITPKSSFFFKKIVLYTMLTELDAEHIPNIYVNYFNGFILSEAEAMAFEDFIDVIVLDRENMVIGYPVIKVEASEEGGLKGTLLRSVRFGSWCAADRDYVEQKIETIKRENR